MILIYAGDRFEAESYARHKGIPRSRWIYMYGYESLRGVTQCTVLLVGTWRTKLGSKDILSKIKERRCWSIEDRDF